MRQISSITVSIRNLAFGGSGVGEVTAQDNNTDDLGGITAFVPFTAPGEIVSAQVLEKKKKHLVGKVLEIIEPSPERVAPPCEWFGVCGGCELQHISYQAQLAAKQAMIRGALLAANIPQGVLDCLQFIRPSKPFGYRRRIALHVDAEGNIGFYRSQSRSVIPITNCLVAEDQLNIALREISSLGPFLRGQVSEVLLESDSKGLVAVFKSPYSLSPHQIARLDTAGRKLFSNLAIIAQGKEAGGYGRQILQLPLNKTGSLSLNVPVGYFSQVNWGVNLELIAEVLSCCPPQTNSRIADLYAGAGNFALPLAYEGAKVTAVESDSRLVALARENMRQNRLEKNLTVVGLSVERFIKEQGAAAQFDTIIADPPRSGLGPLASTLPQSSRLILISCYLPSFVRDLKQLLTLGWDVKQIVSFDMFAQTSYVEIMGVLEKR